MAVLSCAAATGCGADGSCARPRLAHSTSRQQRAIPRRMVTALPRDRLALVEPERELQVVHALAWNRHGIDAGVARAAVRAAILADRAEQAFEAQVRDAVRLEEFANLGERMRGSAQLRLARRVDAVEARR